MAKKFTMSMYVSAEELYKAKAEYYKAALDKLWELQNDPSFDEVDIGVYTYNVLKEVYDD